jgi:hypothetical protein
MRWGALARNAVVIALWVGAIVGLIALEPRWEVAYALGFGATVVAGVVLGRWWALAVPLLVFAVAFFISYVQDPSCSDCGEDPWELQALYGLVLLVLPGIAAMTIGVGISLGALAARRRSRPREQPAP